MTRRKDSPRPGEITTLSQNCGDPLADGHGEFSGDDSTRVAGSPGRCRRAATSLTEAMRQPDQFDWITAFLRERGLLGSARAILATVAGTAGMVPLTVLLGQRRPTTALLVAECTGIALTTVMGLYWWKRWPTRRQSQAAVIAGLTCITVWSQGQPDAAMAAQICMAAAITGGYIAFLHSNRMLALNFAVALTINILTTVRLARVADFANAAGSFWLVLFINLTVPLAIRGATRAIWLYATRSSEDPLTGLLNRPAFTDRLLYRLTHRPVGDTHLIVLLVDLDDFKKVNDTHGHATGDLLLISVADVLRRHLAPATICRAGGEEFLIAYTRAVPDPAVLASRVCAAIAELSPAITASIGVAAAPLRDAPQPMTTNFVDDLIDAADQAMYTAKRNGGNHAHHHPDRSVQQR